MIRLDRSVDCSIVVASPAREQVSATTKASVLLDLLLLNGGRGSGLAARSATTTTAATATSTAELGQLFFASGNDFVEVFAGELLDERVDLLIVGLHFDGAEDGFDVVRRGGGLAPENTKDVCCDVLHL